MKRAKVEKQTENGDDTVVMNGKRHRESPTAADSDNSDTAQFSTPRAAGAKRLRNDTSENESDADFDRASKELERSMLLMLHSWTPEQREKFFSRLPAETIRGVERIMQPFGNTNPFESLPPEVLMYILSYCDVKTMVTLRLVCTYFRDLVARVQPVWMDKYRENGYPMPVLPSAHAHEPVDWQALFEVQYKRLAMLDHNWRHEKPSIRTVTTYSNGVYCIQYDEDKLVSGSRDHKLRIWDFKTLTLRQTMAGHAGSVLCLQYDDRKIVTGSSDQHIAIWDIHTGELRSAVLHVGFDEENVISCSKDSKIKVWELEANETNLRLKFIIADHEAPVNVVHFDKRYIVSASGDKTVKVFRRGDGALVHTFRGHTRGVACLHFYKDWVVSGSSDETIRLWDIKKFRLVRTLEGHTNLVRCIRMNDKFIVSGSYDKSIRVWDVKTGYNIQSFPRVHAHRVFKVLFDNERIVTSSYDDTVAILDFAHPVNGNERANGTPLPFPDAGGAPEAGLVFDGMVVQPVGNFNALSPEEQDVLESITSGLGSPVDVISNLQVPDGTSEPIRQALEVIKGRHEDFRALFGRCRDCMNRLRQPELPEEERQVQHDLLDNHIQEWQELLPDFLHITFQLNAVWVAQGEGLDLLGLSAGQFCRVLPFALNRALRSIREARAQIIFDQIH